jgi:hypothetical protein
MNSITLIERGFSECIPMKTLSFSILPQDNSGVIVIVDKELSGKPESDILYIGRAKKAGKKIMGGYLAGYGGKNAKKINQMLFDEGYIERAVISWTLTDKPRLMQKELLATFKKEHGGLPKWNGKSKKKLVTKTKSNLAHKPKRTPALKTAKVAPKTVAISIPKLSQKAKVPSKKTKPKEESSLRAEPPTKAEADTGNSEEEKAKNEATSEKPMTT